MDVDGHTNLDNVSIAGVTTHKHNIAMEGRRIHFDHSGGNEIINKFGMMVVILDFILLALQV